MKIKMGAQPGLKETSQVLVGRRDLSIATLLINNLRQGHLLKFSLRVKDLKKQD